MAASVPDGKLLELLSPLQGKILTALSSEPLTLEGLSRKTGKTVHTIGKQLSLLQFRTKYNPLKRKGISVPLVRKNKDGGIKTTYCIDAKNIRDCMNKSTAVKATCVKSMRAAVLAQ